MKNYIRLQVKEVIKSMTETENKIIDLINSLNDKEKIIRQNNFLVTCDLNKNNLEKVLEESYDL